MEKIFYYNDGINYIEVYSKKPISVWKKLDKLNKEIKKDFQELREGRK